MNEMNKEKSENKEAITSNQRKGRKRIDRNTEAKPNETRTKVKQKTKLGDN